VETKVLKTNTAVVIAIGPFLDLTDGVTPETAMTVTNITCEMYKETDTGSAPTRTALTLTASGGSNDMVHITSDIAGFYSFELTANDLNFLGRATLVFTDDDVCRQVVLPLLVIPAISFDQFGSLVGIGNVEIDSEYDGNDWRYLTTGGVGIDDATVKVYLKSEYDVGVYTLRASSVTGTDGTWGPVYLNTGLTYTVVFYKSGVYGPDNLEITI